MAGVPTQVRSWFGRVTQEPNTADCGFFCGYVVDLHYSVIEPNRTANGFRESVETALARGGPRLRPEREGGILDIQPTIDDDSGPSTAAGRVRRRS